jgi:hypothetical protein
MRVTSTAAAAIFLAIVLASAAAPALGADTCTDFKWDVSKERALFTGPAASLVSGANVKSAPVIVPNRLYQLQLMPQGRVHFAAVPGKKTPPAGANAGLARLKLPESGSYRVAIDAQFWIDVASKGSLLPAKDFQGQNGCSAPHKIVVFDLSGTDAFILQLSSAASDRVRVTITRTPPRTP